MDVSRHDEMERKYDVGQATMFPDLADVTGVSAVAQPVELELVAVYFDTAELDLARRGMTVRRRTGGDDDGWHLKVPRDKDARIELGLPLGRARKTVPAQLLAPVRAVVRDRPVAPVAKVTTRRLQYDLLGEDAVLLARVCDDEVQADRLLGRAEVQEWREWEVELVDGPTCLLAAVEERVLATGGTPGSASSKLARALGDVAPQAPVAPSDKKLARGSAGHLVLSHVAAQTERLLKQDMRVRADQPDSIHRLRIAARRTRSALTTYRPVLAPGSATTLTEELRWLGQVLSEARDAQVMRERLELLVASEPPELVLGPVASRIDDDLRAAYRAGREHALAALDSERYFRLLDSLDELVHSAPKSDNDDPAKDVVPHLLQRDAKRLRRAVRRIPEAEDAEARDVALHEARKKAKRLRYAAESAVPVFGRRAKTLAASAKKVQEALGEHQDSVIARRRLRDYGVQAHLSGENGFTFGRLHAVEQSRAVKAEQGFRKAWADLPRKRVHRWIRR